MKKLNWVVKAFHQLSVEEYFDILYLRTAIFVVEQNCPYQEVDLKDKQSFHLYGKNEEGEVIAVTRILPPGVSYPEVSIGRVALKKTYRGTGIANELLNESLNFVKEKWGLSSIRISAQTHLISYYQRHGFIAVGQEYLEDNIPHTEMLREV